MCFLWGVRLPFRKIAIKKYEGKNNFHVVFSEAYLWDSLTSGIKT